MAVTSAARGRQVRQKLVAAAGELIPERGWTGVSTRTVAERAGVAPGLVHYHFASLQALLTEAATGAIRGLVDQVGVVLSHADEPGDLVDTLLGSLDRYTGHDPVSLLVTETYLASTRDQQLRQALSVVVADFRRQLAQWLAAHGVSAPEQTAAVLAAAIDGVMLHRVLDPELTAAAIAPVVRRILAV